MRPITLDLSRLATRFSRSTPNGIDTVDLAFARHFLAPERNSNAIILNAFGPRLVSQATGEAVLSGVDAHWRGRVGQPDCVLQLIAAWLAQPNATTRRRIKAPHRRLTDLAASLRPLLSARTASELFYGRSPAASVPRNSIYLNVSQFPLWIPQYFSWLRRRPDVIPIFLIHDLLPITHPEFFPRAEFRRFQARLTVLAQLSRHVIVTSEATAVALRDYPTIKNVPDLKIYVAPLPVSDAFSAQETTFGPGLPDYFVVCGTIEPRKNHLLLLNIWREIVRNGGRQVPKLIVVGARGWGNGNVIDIMERSQDLEGHVLEVSGLTTGGLAPLLKGARALLMPSFAEGYGLPVVEALRLNVPVICSDIEPFKNYDCNGVTRLSPIDGLAWSRCIQSLVGAPRVQVSSMENILPNLSPKCFFEHIEGLLNNKLVA